MTFTTLPKPSLNHPATLQPSTKSYINIICFERILQSIYFKIPIYNIVYTLRFHCIYFKIPIYNIVYTLRFHCIFYVGEIIYYITLSANIIKIKIRFSASLKDIKRII